MSLTLAEIAEDPLRLTTQLDLPTGQRGTLRPLQPHDIPRLHEFYEGLGPRTRQFYDLPPELKKLAVAHCSEIAQYDKLRIVLDLPSGFGGIFEFSLDLVPGDIERFRVQGIVLSPALDIRFGLCLGDALQGRGIATSVQPEMNRIALHLGAQRVILWGGVLASNTKAIGFYRRQGFKEVGPFVADDGQDCLDMLLTLTMNSAPDG